VIKRIAPDVEVIHVSHGIAPQNVLQGALVLARALPFVPAGVHVAVVDPGVGGARRAVALRGRDGRLYVGPDNGLLVLAAENLGGVEAAVEIANGAYMLEPVSATFHGRDVFVPAAAHLARGVALNELGPAVPLEELARLELPRPRVSPNEIVATVLDVDRFGNVQLNLTTRELAEAGIGERLELDVAGRRQGAVVARTFADVAPGETVVYEDAYRGVAVAVNGGSAAEALPARVGATVALRA
jgi:S-adenosyl-L-methionine hydrolase (adenosine-forming)